MIQIKHTRHFKSILPASLQYLFFLFKAIVKVRWKVFWIIYVFNYEGCFVEIVVILVQLRSLKPMRNKISQEPNIQILHVRYFSLTLHIQHKNTIQSTSVGADTSALTIFFKTVLKSVRKKCPYSDVFWSAFFPHSD